MPTYDFWYLIRLLKKAKALQNADHHSEMIQEMEPVLKCLVRNYSFIEVYYFIRICIKDYQLPLVRCKSWKELAKVHTKRAMSTRFTVQDQQKVDELKRIRTKSDALVWKLVWY